MKLYAFCENCNKEVIVKAPFVGDRIGLSRKKGTEFFIECESLHRTKVHVDDVKAKNDKTALIYFLISLIIGIIATLAIWNKGWIVSLSISFPFIILGTVTKSQATAVNVFNQLNYDSKRNLKL